MIYTHFTIHTCFPSNVQLAFHLHFNLVAWFWNGILAYMYVRTPVVVRLCMCMCNCEHMIENVNFSFTFFLLLSLFQMNNKPRRENDWVWVSRNELTTNPTIWCVHQEQCRLDFFLPSRKWFRCSQRQKRKGLASMESESATASVKCEKRNFKRAEEWQNILSLILILDVGILMVFISLLLKCICLLSSNAW